MRGAVAHVPALVKDLNPILDIGGEPQVIVTQAITTVASKDFGKPIASLADRQHAVARTLDVLLTAC